MHESYSIQPRTQVQPTRGAHFILVNGTLSRVAEGEYRRWVSIHNAGANVSNPAGIGDRSEAPALRCTASEAHR